MARRRAHNRRVVGTASARWKRMTGKAQSTREPSGTQDETVPTDAPWYAAAIEDDDPADDPEEG